MRKLTKDEFINKANIIHNNKYDYSKVIYINNRTKICIICPEHGEFFQTPCEHLKGSGCKKCFDKYKRGKSNLLSKDDFVKKAKQVHGNKYDYSKVDYKRCDEKVCIICPEHGEFWQKPLDHVNLHKNCPKCSHRSFKKSTKEFIEHSKSVHGEKYNYSKVHYTNNHTNVCIICPEHGEFWQTPKSHLNGRGCKYCSNKKNGLKKRNNICDFIKKANLIHSNKYDYSKVDYKCCDEKVCIICPEHGEFWQTPHNHINQKQGCPYCSESHIEKEIKEFLIENKIKFEQEKSFDWLIYKRKLKLDFYLPDYNVAIECQGEQHFNKFRWEKNEKKLDERKKRDKTKLDLCKKNGILLLQYSYKKFNDEIVTDKNNLLNIIQKNV